MNKPVLLVLAAGMGSRYGGLKQMDGLGPAGEVLLEYSVFDALRAGFGKVVFIVRKDIEALFKEIVISRFPSSVPIELVYQELDHLLPGYTFGQHRAKPWGTAHALWCTRHAVKENFAVLNADDFYGFSGFKKLIDFFSNTPEDQLKTQGALVGFRLGKTLSDSGSVARGICQTNEHGFLSSIEEKTDITKTSDGIACDLDSKRLHLTENELVSMNFWGFSTEVFQLVESRFSQWLQEHHRHEKAEFLLPTVVDELVKEGKLRIKVLDSEDEWIGVTYANDKVPTQQKLAEYVRAGKYPSPLWQSFN